MLVRISNISVQESISGVECQVFGLKLFRIASNQIRVEIYTDRFSLPSSVSRSVDRIRIESRSSIESDLSRRGRSLPSQKINDQKSIVTDRKILPSNFAVQETYKKRANNAWKRWTKSRVEGENSTRDNYSKLQREWRFSKNGPMIGGRPMPISTDHLCMPQTTIVAPIQFPSSLHF